jgi:hypothetical protein
VITGTFAASSAGIGDEDGNGGDLAGSILYSAPKHHIDPPAASFLGSGSQKSETNRLLYLPMSILLIICAEKVTRTKRSVERTLMAEASEIRHLAS